MEIVLVAFLISISVSPIGWLWYHHKRRKTSAELLAKLSADTAIEVVPSEAASNEAYQISYIPSDIQWSGSTTGALPIKTLTYKQYECLEDARYGFMVVGATPTERKKKQPEKTRAHGLKTVASLVNHGFLAANGLQAYVITDHGLNALAVCDVRY